MTTQKPVAWRGINWSGDGNDYCYRDYDDPPVNAKGENVGEPLYLAPLQREWQGLTDEEHVQIAADAGCASADWVFYGAALERALKEKNK